MAMAMGDGDAVAWVDDRGKTVRRWVSAGDGGDGNDDDDGNGVDNEECYGDFVHIAPSIDGRGRVRARGVGLVM